MFLSLLEKRRSIRRFTKEAVKPGELDVLIEAALRSFSSMGRNPWEFVVVRDREKLEALSKAKPHGASFLKNAPLGIVICVDPEKTDVWVEDASIAATFILLSAESMGLGGCWIQIRKRMHDQEISAEAYVAEALGVPERLRIEALVAVGHPDEKKPPHAKQELDYEKVFFERYGNRAG